MLGACGREPGSIPGPFVLPPGSEIFGWLKTVGMRREMRKGYSFQNE